MDKSPSGSLYEIFISKSRESQTHMPGIED
jgi:hypothetical protein